MTEPKVVRKYQCWCTSTSPHPDLVVRESDYEALAAEVEEWKRVASEQARMHDEAASEVERLQETNRRLNRRCQSAERGLAVKVEEVERKGGSFGRALSGAAYTRVKAENAKLREHVAYLENEQRKHGWNLP